MRNLVTFHPNTAPALLVLTVSQGLENKQKTEQKTKEKTMGF